MGEKRYTSADRFGGRENALARDNGSASVSAYSGSGDSTADAKAIAAMRKEQAGNEDPIAYAMRISKEKKALAAKKAKEKADAEAQASARTESNSSQS